MGEGGRGEEEAEEGGGCLREGKGVCMGNIVYMFVHARRRTVFYLGAVWAATRKK